MFRWNCCEATRLRSRLISVAFVTSLGCVHQKLGSFEIIWVYVYHRILPRLQVIKMELRNNFDHQSGIDVEEKILFRVAREPHFCGRKVWKQVKVVQIPTTKADLSLRIFVAVPGTLKCPSPHASDCAAALYVIIYILAKMLFYGLLRYLFAYSCGKIERFNTPEISPKLSGENFGHLRM